MLVTIICSFSLRTAHFFGCGRLYLARHIGVSVEGERCGVVARHGGEGFGHRRHSKMAAKKQLRKEFIRAK